MVHSLIPRVDKIWGLSFLKNLNSFVKRWNIISIFSTVSCINKISFIKIVVQLVWVFLQSLLDNVVSILFGSRLNLCLDCFVIPVVLKRVRRSAHISIFRSLALVIYTISPWLSIWLPEFIIWNLCLILILVLTEIIIFI